MKFVSFYTIVVVLFAPLSSQAQLDSSYELLLGVPTSTTNSVTTAPDATKKNNKKRGSASEEVPTNVQAPAFAPAIEIPQGRPLPVKLEPAPGEPTIGEQAQSLFTENPDKVLGFYQDQFGPQDPRQNKIEISFSPSFITNESSSNFSYRDYRSIFTGMNLGANVWLTPAIGVGGNFLFSLGADTSGDALTNTRSPARYEFLDIGLKFRKFFGFSPTSKSVEFNILYSDYKFNVNADDVYRSKLKTSGLGLKMTLKLPSNSDVAWLMGGSFYPRLQHAELKSGVDIGSGNNTENVRVGLHLGAEVTLSRESQIFYEAAMSSEKNMFDGSAELPDPVTLVTPRNVSVTDTFYMFSVGYRWGN